MRRIVPDPSAGVLVPADRNASRIADRAPADAIDRSLMAISNNSTRVLVRSTVKACR